jgi:Pilus formation protein N terminal region
MNITLRATTALCLLITCAAAQAEELILKTDETKLLKISKTPGTIVIGNPSIADATIEGKNVFLQGKAFGSTNIIILDDKGDEIVNYDVTIQIGGNHNMAVFKPTGRFSYTCAPLCEAQMQVGDPTDYVSSLVEVTETKSNLAKGISNQDSSKNNSAGNAPSE